MSKRIATALLTAATIMGVAVIAPAALAGSCDTRDRSLEYLEANYGETPIARAVNQSGRIMVEVLRSEGGSWTILTTNTDGISCVLAAGEDWTDLKVIPIKDSGPGV